VSFAAVIPKGTSGSEYLLGGVDGKFPGRFRTMPYYQKIKEYGKIENRDIWEYRLNLNEQEVNRLLMHLWEIRGIDFEYYFADENCSYRLMELLDVARPGSHLTKQAPLYVIPSETIREIIAKRFVLPGHHYRPSLATQLRTSINALTRSERDTALAISHNPHTLQAEAFKSLPDPKKSVILRTVYQYARWKELKYWHYSNEATLIKALAKLPPAKKLHITPPSSPDQGHPPFRIQLAGGSEKKNYFQIGIRPLYHDLTDNPRGYSFGSGISFLNIQARVMQGQIYLHRFNLLQMTSLRATDRFMTPLSWDFGIGLARSSVATGYHLMSKLHGSVGLSFPCSSDAVIAVMPAMRAEYHPDLSQFRGVSAGISIAFLRQKNWGTTLIKWKYYHRLTSSLINNRLMLSQSFSINRTQAVRFGLQFKEKINRNHLNSYLEYIRYL